MKLYFFAILGILCLTSSYQAKADSVGLLCTNRLKEESPRIFNIDLSGERGAYFDYKNEQWKWLYRVKIGTYKISFNGRTSINRMNLTMKSNRYLFGSSELSFKGWCATKETSELRELAQRELSKLKNNRAF